MQFIEWHGDLLPTSVSRDAMRIAAAGARPVRLKQAHGRTQPYAIRRMAARKTVLQKNGWEYRCGMVCRDTTARIWHKL
jgi:hypothetical protein